MPTQRKLSKKSEALLNNLCKAAKEHGWHQKRGVIVLSASQDRAMVQYWFAIEALTYHLLRLEAGCKKRYAILAYMRKVKATGLVGRA